MPHPNTQASLPSAETPATGYIGRFAPSPTGPLHFGSLLTALASYLDAKANGGRWLVRMEDLDPPREEPGAATTILKCLEDHGLEWDGEVFYQSADFNRYQEQLDALIAADLAYPCSCSRQRLQSLGGIYDGYCRHHPADLNLAHAWRLKLYDLPAPHASEDLLVFQDLIQGRQVQNLRTQAGDQILKRRDGYYAYQLAVVVDDIAQGITHVIRGADLLEVSARQIFLFQLLGTRAPAFGHVPLAIQANGQKLSKQNHAPALLAEQAVNNLWRALEFLGQNPPADMRRASCLQLLDWAIEYWRRDQIQGLARLHQEQ